MQISQNWGESPDDGGIVHRPNPGDTLGRALRGVYGGGTLPEDMRRLLARIDAATQRH